MNYLLIATLLALATVSMAGTLSCPYYEIPYVPCMDDSACSAYSQSYCKKYSGYGYGVCAAPERDCASDEVCFREGNNYVCLKDTQSSCTADVQCVYGQKCTNGKCVCPAVPDFGSKTCYVPDDSFGKNYGLTVCNDTGRVCAPATNVAFPLGSCISSLNGPCDVGNDCFSSYRCDSYHCKCLNPSDLPTCKPYNKVTSLMVTFENCVKGYTNPCSTTNIESCCDTALSNCKYILKQMGTLPENNLDSIIQQRVSYYKIANAATAKICSYREYLSDLCNTNYRPASV